MFFCQGRGNELTKLKICKPPLVYNLLRKSSKMTRFSESFFIAIPLNVPKGIWGDAEGRGAEDL